MNTHDETTAASPEFEQGPIRPPSEAHSLLIRVTRNCPWNRCTFCPVYKGTKFSIRTVHDVTSDIDAIYRHAETLRQRVDESGRISQHELTRVAENLDPTEAQAFAAAYHWLSVGGMRSVFLQDANSLAIKTPDLLAILSHLRRRFPAIKRVTSYARAQTIAHKSELDLKAIRDGGLDRLHLGLESGCNEVLKAVKKGVTKEMHIEAGRKSRKAGFELSEYYMPGLGGRNLSEAHALESADALNKIDPHYIRLRTLAIPSGAPIAEDLRTGRFDKCTDVMVARELLMFIEHLDGIRSIVKSDHILNLFEELEGVLPRDQGRMIETLRTFLALEPKRQMLYQVGRRLGLLSRIDDMKDPHTLALIEETCQRMKITPLNVDALIDDIVRRYV